MSHFESTPLPTPSTSQRSPTSQAPSPRGERPCPFQPTSPQPRPATPTSHPNPPTPGHPERPATFSPADQVQEFQGRAPTCSTTCPQSSPGPPERRATFSPAAKPRDPRASPDLLHDLPTIEPGVCRGPPLPGAWGCPPYLCLLLIPPSLRKGLGDGETPANRYARHCHSRSAPRPSVLRRSQEIRGRAPTSSTTCPQSSPGNSRSSERPLVRRTKSKRSEGEPRLAPRQNPPTSPGPGAPRDL